MLKNLLSLIAVALFAQAQAQTLSAKYIDVKYTLQGCQRNDTDVTCVFSSLYTGNGESDLLHIGDADTSALAGGMTYEPSSYDVGGAGGAITGSIGKIYKSAPTKVSFTFRNIPKTITSFSILNVQGAIFKNVKISSVNSGDVVVDAEIIKHYRITLKNCSKSNGVLVCNGVSLLPLK